VDVSESNAPEFVAARKRFATILKNLPGPEGHAGLKQPQSSKGKAKQGKRKTAE
jgi:hypothetical protein